MAGNKRFETHLKQGDLERLQEIAREPLVPNDQVRRIIGDPRVEEVSMGPDGIGLVRYKGTSEFVPWSPQED